MNNNTTIILALVCAALAAVYFVARDRVASSPPEMPVLPTNPDAQTSHDLLEEDAKLGDVVRVEIQREGKDTLVFEKNSDSTPGLATWHMTAPVNMEVRSYEAESFGRNINSLKYQISYMPGEPGTIAAADAGLKPPAGRITIEDKDGKKVAVEVGKRISKTERYVRLVGDDRICVGKTDLLGPLKSNLIEYRDQSLWSFAPADATRIEATDRTTGGTPLHYKFLKDGDKWMMTSPVSAKTTDKVAEMVIAVSHLRVTKWEADAGDRLAAYGLDPAAFTIKITVEKKVPVETANDSDDETDTDDKPKPVEMKTETKTYLLHVSNRSPIGEDTKTYLRIGDETMVATVMKTMADKLKPVMDQWRDMRITSANTDTASRITISVSGNSTAFTKSADGWKFESDGGSVETSQITELLGSIKSLKAVAFVETSGGDLNQYGLAQPRAAVAVTIPGLESPLRIAVGDYTDAKAKRLIYVRKNDATSIAKVRTRNVDALLKKPLLYRDRTIFTFDPDAIASIQLTRVEQAGEKRSVVAFERKDGTWRMTEPVKDEANQTKLTELATTLSNLKSLAVVASSDEATSFGLHAPKIKVAITLKPEKTDQTQTLTFSATDHDGKFYLKRDDHAAIYELQPQDYHRLNGEFRSTQLCSAREDEVTAFTIAREGNEQIFKRAEGKWTYQSEPDLPLDQEKVKTLLKQILGLNASRYVRHTNGDLAEFGLIKPSRTLTLSLKDGGTWRLDVSAQSESANNPDGFFASTPNHPGVVVISATIINRIAVDLDDLEAK